MTQSARQTGPYGPSGARLPSGGETLPRIGIRPLDPLGVGDYTLGMTHTNPALNDREGHAITIGALVEFDGIGVYGRVTNLYPYASPPSVAVHWFGRDATEHSNPARLCVVMDGPVAESAAEVMRQQCGWLTPCAEPTKVVHHERLGPVKVCTVCTRLMGLGT